MKEKIIVTTDEQRETLKEALKTMQSDELIELREDIEKAIRAEEAVPVESEPIVERIDESILSVKDAEETVVIEAYGKTFEFHVPAGAVKRYPVVENGECYLMVDDKKMDANEVRGSAQEKEPDDEDFIERLYRA